MIIIENILIIAIVGFALGYLIKLVWSQFYGDEKSAGCSSCSSGSCGTKIPDFSEIAEMPPIKRK